MSMIELIPDQLLGGSEEPLVAATRGAVRILVINRPQVRNAMSLELRKAFARMTREADADPEIKVVIITGAHGVFSAGVDLKEMIAGGGGGNFRPNPAEAARAMAKPLIAAVDGICVTGALELTLSCSFIIASDRSRFADTHARRGLFPGWGLSALLPSAVGVRRARQLSLTGEFIDARTAYEWGLVNELTTPERLLPRCLELAEGMMSCSEESVLLQIEVMSRSEGASFDVALAAEEAARRRLRGPRKVNWPKVEAKG
ncbi:MAG: enoyl-CoA hydratase/isomerase family protein [Caulobacteraceae bacterium]|nr:enoyl-CoA hydratase/isomerase family protein [Caulobacteraceae bacterium]